MFCIEFNTEKQDCILKELNDKLRASHVGMFDVSQDGSEVRCDVDFSLLKAHVCGAKSKGKEKGKERGSHEGDNSSVRDTDLAGEKDKCALEPYTLVFFLYCECSRDKLQCALSLHSKGWVI